MTYWYYVIKTFRNGNSNDLECVIESITGQFPIIDAKKRYNHMDKVLILNQTPINKEDYEVLKKVLA